MVIPHLVAFLSWTLNLSARSFERQRQLLTLEMIVPNLSGLHNATELNNSSETAIVPTQANLTDVTKTLRKFGQDGVLRQAYTGRPRSEPAKKEAVHGLQDRQSCSSGSAYYSCANGFRGCCSVDPCDPGGTCPDGQSSSTTAAASATSAESTTAADSTTSTAQSSSTDSTSTVSETTVASSETSTAKSGTDTSSIISASATGSATSTAATTSSSAVSTPAPACPAGNGTTFTDSSSIAYMIHCNMDNSYSTENTIQVGTGGYSECFSACSVSSVCAGFTYDGLDSGNCYLKQQMPSGDYVAKNASNYISCAKVNATDVAPSVSTSGSASSAGGAKKSTAGVIAGGVIGGIAFLGLLLLLVALIARHRRKRIEERRATITHIIHGPIEAQEMVNTSPAQGHARSRSTALDAFAPFGGFYRGFSSTQADRQVDDDTRKASEAGRLTPDRPPPSLPPGLRAEGAGTVLPATAYTRPSNPSADAVAMLDSTPIRKPVAKTPGSRSPRFREHIAEMEDTSSRLPLDKTAGNRSPRTPDTDSPTLGRDSSLSGPSLADSTRRKQHLMSWNDDAGSSRTDDQPMSATMKGRPAARSPDVSPDLSNTPRDSKFVVSPLGSIDWGRPRQT